jgi:Domain of unknown function (DUF4124)
MRSILLAALVAVPAFAQQVYSWEDKDGVHYTDDPAQVPKGAKVASEKLAPAPSAGPSAAVATSTTPSAAAAQPSSIRATPQDERRWRDRFIEAYRRIETLKQSINALASSIPPVTTCTTVQQQSATGEPLPVQQQCYPNHARDRMVAELAQKRVDLKDAELDIDRLEREATMAQVPREWRRGW